jgi:hypothetical protein
MLTTCPSERAAIGIHLQLELRELYMSFADLVFFADAGNGDQFAFSVQSNQIRKPDTYAWNHENDSRVWVASSLRQYIEWWATGKIEL